MKKIITFLLLITGFGFSAQSQIITTIAGSGTPTNNYGYTGNGGPATQATLDQDSRIALDDSGNIYVCDSHNHVIRKVSAKTGIITTVAGDGYGNGSGNGGYSGDGGEATAAELNNPQGVYVDDSGNIYIADYANARIRKVTAKTGIITTVAGNGTTGWNGDGIQATDAELSYPAGVTLDDSGNIFITDQWNWVIREVSAKTGIINTVAGDYYKPFFGFSGNGGPATAAQLSLPGGTVVDDSGNLYISDVNNNEIRKVTKATGIITDYAGSPTGASGYSGDEGQATLAELYHPCGIHLDDSGNIYFADANNNIIRKILKTTGIITTIAGDGTQGFSGNGGLATSAELNNPLDVIEDPCGNLYIADYQNNLVRKVSVIDSIKVPPFTSPICSGGSDTLTATGGSNYTWSPSTGLSDTTGVIVIASPTATTTYTISGLGACGGSAVSATVVVSVTAAPSLSVTQQPSHSICGGQSALLYVSGASGLIWTPTTGLMDSTSSNDSVTVNPTITTTYTVTGISSGCASTGTDIVTVIPAPSFTVLPLDTSFCSGQSTILYVDSGGSSFVWTPINGIIDSTLSGGDSVVVSPTATTTYTVTGNNPSGCATSGIDVVTIIASPGTPTFTQDGDTLISSSVHDNQWYRNDTLLRNDTSQHLIINIPGEYYVVVTNEVNGCSTSSDSANVKLAGINQLSVIGSRLSIYPNPFNNNIFIKINTSAGDLSNWSLQVTDVLGRPVYNQQSLNNSNDIDLSNLSNGVYFITVMNKTGRTVVPVVKQN